MKVKLKLRKQAWIGVGVIVGVIILIIVISSIIKNVKYQSTYEYKLLEAGYTQEEITILESHFSEDELLTLSETDKNDFLLQVIEDDYYIEEYFDRYMAYHDEHTDRSARDVVALVNTNNDHSYYDYDIDTDISQNELMLVNKFYHLSADYEPDDLVNISNRYYYGEDHQIREVVYDAFVDMWNQASMDGITLIINSSYWNYQDQQETYDYYKDSRGTTYADSIAARAGYSEHQTGLALDIFSTEHTTTSNFKDSPAHEWLVNNAYKYGFIERYQEDTEEITGFAEEAWHWRYVGVEVATYLHEHDITFDEYYAYFIENK